MENKRIEKQEVKQGVDVGGVVQIIRSGHPPTGEVRLLRLATQRPWMFSEPNHGMEMPDVWFPFFEELCADISFCLGDQRHGFHWNCLTREGKHPYWYWRFGDEMDQCVGMVRKLTGIDFSILNPPADPENKLRDCIAVLVKKAQNRAALCGVPSLENRGKV